LGINLDDYIDQLSDYGAEKIYLVDDEILSEYSLDTYAPTLTKLIDKYTPKLVAMGATPTGSELAPRIAARLNLPCITETKRIDIEKENILIAKAGFGDKVFMNFDIPPDTPVVITLIPGDIESEKVSEPGKMEIVREECRIDSEADRIRNIKFIKGDPKEIRLEEAEFIVAGGVGVGSEGMPALEELADILQASVGGTRPLVDIDVIPFERQIGITGKFVNPKLIIACGISGAREFTMGIDKGTLIIAINKDAKAPIFNAAQLGALADTNVIIPELIKAVNERRESE
jgi:electron transfer flavoprotein alpha subunit